MAVYYTQEGPSFLEQMLSSGLQAYQQKRQEVKQGQALSQLSGLDPEQAAMIANLSPEMQKTYIDSLTKSRIAGKDNIMQQQQFQQLIELMGLGDQQPMQEQSGIAQMFGFGEQNPAQQLPDIAQMMGSVQQAPVQEQGFNLGQSLGMQLPQEQVKEQGRALAKRYTQSQINSATLINPNIGRAMQAQNDAIDKTRQEGTKIAQQERSEMYKNNLPAYKDVQTSIKKYKSEKVSLDELARLNSSDKLPEKMSINVNPKTGDLIIPALANPEMQRYVKLINDFTTKAKDSYGSRVTNFELDRFMKRLPTLSNSVEGRTQILEQMSIINELNALKDQELKKVYDEYGIGNIDYQQANILAEKAVSEKEAELIERMNDIGTIDTKGDTKSKENLVDTLPASAKEGSIARDTQSGASYKFSKGKWRKI